MADPGAGFVLDPPGLLGGLDPGAFLRDYWQRRPLLIRGALPGFRSPLSGEELAGLACEEEVESRLVLQEAGAGSWALRHGPFTEADFLTLPETHWTLLVQELDKLVPEAAELLRRFRFLPDWRVDDVMASYAPEGGSVGPHVDSYDVFLLQAAGRRRWEIGAPVDPGAALVADSDLRILDDFTPVEGWELGPGDMLYLPPGVPHHGVALDPGQTWSIGFRSPSVVDLVGGLADEVAASLDPELRYTDPGRAVTGHPGRIEPAELERLQALALEAVESTDPAAWVGRLITENRSGLAPPLPETPAIPGDPDAPIRPGVMIRRQPGARFAYAEREGAVLLFVDGERWEAEGHAAELARALCDHGESGPLPDHPPTLHLVAELYNRGSVDVGQGQFT